MAIQSNILKRPTIGFLPPLFSNNILNQMKPFFDNTYTDISSICKALNDGQTVTKQDNINYIFDSNVDGKKIIYDTLNQGG